MADYKETIESLKQKQITRMDSLTISQRLLVQAMILLVKNGHTHKFTYHLCFKTLKSMRKRYLDLTRIEYAFDDFVKDIRALSCQRVEYINEQGYGVGFTWLMNASINRHYETAKYNFPKKLSKLCTHYNGKKFGLLLLDFMELENKHSRRLFRFLAGCQNTQVTCHKLTDLIKYFELCEELSASAFVEQVIKPAIQEITHKSLFSFSSIVVEVVEKNEQAYIKITFITNVKKYLPKLVGNW